MSSRHGYCFSDAGGALTLPASDTTDATEKPKGLGWEYQLGPLDEVTAKLNATFPGLTWDSPTECGLKVEGGFLAELTVEDDLVSDIYTRGGYNHLKPLATLCRREGWRLGDAQEGEDVDLDDPYRWYEQHGG